MNNMSTYLQFGPLNDTLLRTIHQTAMNYDICVCFGKQNICSLVIVAVVVIGTYFFFLILYIFVTFIFILLCVFFGAEYFFYIMK